MCLVDCRQCLMYIQLHTVLCAPSYTMRCIHVYTTVQCVVYNVYSTVQCVAYMCTQVYSVFYTMCIQLHIVLHTYVHNYTVCCVQTNVGRKLKNANFSIRSIRSKVDYQQPNIAQRLFCIQNERQDILYHLNFGCAVHTLDST